MLRIHVNFYGCGILSAGQDTQKCFVVDYKHSLFLSPPLCIYVFFSLPDKIISKPKLFHSTTMTMAQSTRSNKMVIAMKTSLPSPIFITPHTHTHHHNWHIILYWKRFCCCCCLAIKKISSNCFSIMLPYVFFFYWSKFINSINRHNGSSKCRCEISHMRRNREQPKNERSQGKKVSTDTPSGSNPYISCSIRRVLGSSIFFFNTIIGSCLRIFFFFFHSFSSLICSRSIKHANPFFFFIHSVCVHRKKPLLMQSKFDWNQHSSTQPIGQQEREQAKKKWILLFFRSPHHFGKQLQEWRKKIWWHFFIHHFGYTYTHNHTDTSSHRAMSEWKRVRACHC